MSERELLRRSPGGFSWKRPRCDSCELLVGQEYVTVTNGDSIETLCETCHRLRKLGLLPLVGGEEREEKAHGA